MTTKFQVVRPLTEPERERLKQSIQQWGILNPIQIDENGNIIDGHHRRDICEELGIDCPHELVWGLTDDEKRERARTLNEDRRHLSQKELSQAILAEAEKCPSMTSVDIAKKLGISRRTVGRATRWAPAHHGGEDGDSAGVHGAPDEIIYKVRTDGKRVPKSYKQMHIVIDKALERWPDRPATEIAKKLGCDEKAVRGRRQFLQLGDDGARPRREINETISVTISTLSGVAMGLDIMWRQIEEIDKSRAAAWLEELDEAMKSIRKLHNHIKRIVKNGNEPETD